MRSSTSNSSSRAKVNLSQLNWLRMLIIIAALALFIIGCWEALWRTKGFVPSITDDWPVWSDLRRSANRDEHAIVLLGASRILLGLDPVIVAKAVKAPVYMLAIDGSNPLPILANLAEDESFTGTVICSLTPYFLAGNSTSNLDRTAKWLRKYASQSLSSRMETQFSLFLQSHLVFRSSSLSLDKIFAKWKDNQPVRPPYAPMRPDRYREADYTKTNLAALRAARERRTEELHQELELLDHHSFLQKVGHIEKMIRRINARGGKVIFIRFPSCGRVLNIENNTIPRADYWDVFTNHISAAALHFEDFPQLQDFSCTDGSHLQYDDAVLFSRELTDILRQRSLM